MHPLQIAALLALAGFAVYRQSTSAPVRKGISRFKMPLIYAVIGLAAGGFALPQTRGGWAELVVGALLGAALGIVRGALMRVWRDGAGVVWQRGTPLTIGLFVLVVGSKFAFGAYEYLHGLGTGGDRFGEILVLIALMMAPQIVVVDRRAKALAAAGAFSTGRALSGSPRAAVLSQQDR